MDDINCRKYEKTKWKAQKQIEWNADAKTGVIYKISYKKRLI